MSWDGYFEYAGQEMINVSRTEAYAADAPWFRPLFQNGALGPMLGEPTYTTPVLDDAPWMDPDEPASGQFWGVYPLGITGIEDSSRTSTVIQSTGDGGSPGRVRHATKTVVFNAALLGEADCGVEYGLRWLKQLLLGAACGPRVNLSCGGGDLCFFSCAPGSKDPCSGQIISATSMDDHDGGTPSTTSWPSEDDGGTASTTGTTVIDACDPFLSCLSTAALDRSLRGVVFNSGPTVTAKRQTKNGGTVWTVTFTAVAASPYEFGPEVGIVEGFLDPDVVDPYLVPDGEIDLDGFIFDDENIACATSVYQPVNDPLCPAIVPPPAPPTVPLGCYTAPSVWTRRQFTIPRAQIPLWGDVVPKLELHARFGEVRNVRLRFYADVFGDGSIEDDPCSFCGDIIFSYIPNGSTLVFDASDQVVYVEAEGRKRRADHLVFGSGGVPFEWPILSCGFDYIVTLDVDGDGEPALPVVDLSLFARVA